MSVRSEQFLQQGLRAYRAADYGVAAHWFQEAIKLGDALAQTYLGLMHLEGRGVVKDCAAAFTLFSTAATQGCTSAQYNLGLVYARGYGVEIDNAAAATWFRRAAERGSSLGQYSLGVMYVNGRGVPQNFGEGAKWFRLAADSERRIKSRLYWNETDSDTLSDVASGWPTSLLAQSAEEACVATDPASLRNVVDEHSLGITEFAIPTEDRYPEYPIPTGFPYNIVAGPDDALWFTQQGPSKIGRISVFGEISEYTLPTLGSGPLGIAAGPDGAIWFTEHDAAKIGRLTMGGEITEYELPTPSCYPRCIVAGSDGAMWFTERAVGKIGRISPSGEITEYALPNNGSHPDFITSGPDRALWFTEDLNDRIGRITTSGEIAEFALPMPGSTPNGIAPGPDGALWFAERNASVIGRITTDGIITEFPVNDGGIYGITAGPDGGMWFTMQAANKIGQITMAGEITQFPLPTTWCEPELITLGPDGALWFTEYHANAIGRLKPNPTVIEGDRRRSTTAATTAATPFIGTEVWRLPVTEIVPLNEGAVSCGGEGARIVTDSRRWMYSAAAIFEIPLIGELAHIVTIRLRVKNGTLGIGWLRQDEQDWVARASADRTEDAIERHLLLPVGASGNRLIFDNWSPGGTAAQAVVYEVSARLAGDAEAHFRAGLAAEEVGDIAGATAQFEAALANDPHHVAAIAGRGRLRFAPPDTPFRTELGRRVAPDSCEVFIQLRNPCNYRCFYCVAKGRNNIAVQKLDLAAISDVYARLDHALIVTSLEPDGGEPTIHPQFAELARICSGYGALSFPTNNSQNPERWLPRETADRLLVRATLHPEAEPELSRFLRYARYLIEAGCGFQALFIAHPERLSKLDKYREIFAAEGIPLTAIAFMGEFDGKTYPHAYTAEEIERIGLRSTTRFWLHQIEPYVSRVRDFRGIPCIAGHRSLFISGSGRLYRCKNEGRELAAPLTQAEPCGVKRCSCGLFLEALNTTISLDFYNGWAARAGAEPIEAPWAESLARTFGYDGMQDALAVEGRNIYDALIRAYRE